MPVAIDISSSARAAISFDPARPTPARSTFLPFSSSPPTTLDAAVAGAMAPRTSNSSATPARASLSLINGSLLPSFYSTSSARPSSSTAVASSGTVPASGPYSSEFDGIVELSEADFTAEELERSARKARQRNKPTSSAVSWSDTVDLSGPSSPVRHPLASSSTAPRPSSPSKSSSPLKLSSPVRAVSPQRSGPATRRRRRVASSDASDSDVASSLQQSSRSGPSAKKKGKARAVDPPTPVKSTAPLPDLSTMFDDDDDDAVTCAIDPTPVLSTTTTSAHVSSTHDVLDEELDDDYDDPDYNAIFENIDIPDFSTFPASQAPRDPSPEPYGFGPDDWWDGEDVEVVNAAPAKEAVDNCRPVPHLTLISDLDSNQQAFYRDHFRRGADASDSGSDDDGTFGVAAVAQRGRLPARGRGRGRARGGGGWRGRGRGRGRGRK